MILGLIFYCSNFVFTFSSSSLTLSLRRRVIASMIRALLSGRFVE